MIKCNHCSKQFKTQRALSVHQAWVDGKLTRIHIDNARKKSPSNNIPKINWQCPCGVEKKLTPFHAKKRKFCSNSCPAKPKPKISNETREKQSNARKKFYKENPRANPFFGRTPSNYQGWGKGHFSDYLGHWVRSTWELEYLMVLKQNNIFYEYEPQRFDLGDCTYLPDAKLSDTLYVEITGWDKPGKEEKRNKFCSLYPDIYLLVIKDKPTEVNKQMFLIKVKEVLSNGRV